ncbi:MAG TPA: HD domain-containing phosphohydrolase [Bacillota bacterium]
MRITPIEEIKPGMKLARAVYREEDGSVLLRPNIELKSNYIERIKELKYSHVYTLNPDESGEEIIDDPVDEELRFRARGLLKKTVGMLKSEEKVSLSRISVLVAEMVEQVYRQTDIVYNMVDIRSRENYLYAHSVNVCVIALMIGASMSLNRMDMEKMGVGALLHDLGLLAGDTPSAQGKGSSHSGGPEAAKQHPRAGYELLKQKTELNFLAAHVALQHHEREDGSGYPRGLTGKRIHRFAKIVAVADAFDTLTHRSFQKGLAPYQAIQDIKADQGKYDEAVVDNFLKVMAPYPIGSVLLLDSGETVLVERVSRYECQVRVLAGGVQGTVYNLYQASKIKVVQFLN